LLGEKAAMACTVAVEATITEHYNDQIRELVAVRGEEVLLRGVDSKEDKETVELMEWIRKFRDEEQEHHDTGIREGAEQTPGYEILSSVIKGGCKAAIWVAQRV
jgi:ubiquinone biosynthesis monooxygenase Coq7